MSPRPPTRWRAARARPALLFLLTFVALTACADDAPTPVDVDALSKADARAHRDATLWAPEREAQRHEATITAMWDRVRGSADKLAALAEAPFASLALPELGDVEPLEHGVERRVFVAPGAALDRDAVRALAQQFADAGWSLHASDWQHPRFVPAAGGAPARSRVSFTLHVTRAEPERRAILRGELDVTWRAPASSAADASNDAVAGESRSAAAPDSPTPAAVRVTALTLLQRDGALVFEELAAWPAPQSGPRPGLAEPILLHDLDADGLTDIVLANANTVHFANGAGGFRAAPLCAPELPADAALLADLNGDGAVDLLTAAGGDVPRLFTRREDGVFVDPEPVDAVRPALKRPMAITAGDIDADGDLDVFLAQYKLPYLEGQMPTPFDDANDGWHSYLLVNDGAGRFVDATQSSGLAPKRLRRSYSASFSDLDGDRDLDLLVVSDFAGHDMYLNDGTGHFTDVTDARFGAGHASFGMSHLFTDANADGLLDLLVIGMNSVTVERLEALGLARDDLPDFRARRAAMAYGNRLYLNQGDGRYEPAPHHDALARTGWSWGVTAFDLENDGDRELFVANGHLSGASARDYDSSFWTHDLFDADSAPDPEAYQLFAAGQSLLNAGRTSWNGFQKNVLLQRAGDAWVDTAFLFGVAHAWDARAALSADVNADGRADLIVVERTPVPVRDAPPRHDVVHVFANRWPDPGHWLGVRLLPARGLSVLGATITVRDTAGRAHLHHVTSGDGHRSQHDAAVVIGLGDARPARLEVLWPGGRRTEVAAPPSDRYVTVGPDGLR